MTDLDVFEDVSNPLDSVEEILSANDWTFNRMNEDELTVQISGKMSEYSLFFVWHDEYSAIQFSCDIDLAIHKDKMDMAARALTAINSDLWLGHFEMDTKHRMPRFRHTSLFRGMNGSSGADHIEDLVDIAIHECERFVPLFNLMTSAETCDDKVLQLAMMDPAGAS